MTMRRAKRVALLACAAAAATAAAVAGAGPAGGKPEKLLGLRTDADRDELLFEVWTGGCTAKRSFRVERTGAELTLIRLERDACKMMPQATTVTFGLEELGLKRNQPFTVRNAFVADPLAASLQ